MESGTNYTTGMTATEEILRIFEEQGNIVTDAPTIDGNKEFEKIFNDIPYWEKYDGYINPYIKPKPYPTWGKIGENTPFCLKGGICTIAAPIGVGKTTMTLAILTAIATGRKIGNFTPVEKSKVKIMIFDTEQPDEDIYHKIQLVKSSNNMEFPDNIRIVPLMGVSKRDRLKMINEKIKEDPDFFPDIVVIDTLTRLSTDINDPKEAQGYEDVLFSIAKLHTLFCVIHVATGTDKAKGHLGTNIEEVSSTEWIGQPIKNGIFSLKPKKVRGIAMHKAENFEMMINDESGAFEDTSSQRAEEAQTRKKELEGLFSQIYDGKKNLEPKDLFERYRSFCRLSGMKENEMGGRDAFDNKRNEAVRYGILTRKRNPRNKQSYLYYWKDDSDFKELDLDDL